MSAPAEDLKKGIVELSNQLRYLEDLSKDADGDNGKADNLSVKSGSGRLASLTPEERWEREWKEELARRSAQLRQERDAAEERRRQHAAARSQWEAFCSGKEGEVPKSDSKPSEQHPEHARLRELEADVKQEMEREEAFQKELQSEHDLTDRTLAAMDQEHGQAAERLGALLQDADVSEALRKGGHDSDRPNVALSVAAIINERLSAEERRQLLVQRDRERLRLLAGERERQRELEQRWAEQRIQDKLREEELRRVKLLVTQGEVMDLRLLYKLKRRILTEEEKQQVPNYVISSLMRTMMESKERDCVLLSIKVLCRLLHGIDLDRKAKVCEAMVNSINGLTPFVQTFNRFQEDIKLLKFLLVLLKLCMTYSQTFVMVGLQQGVWDVANSITVPGFQPEPFKEITSFTPTYSEGAARQCLETLKQVLMMNPPDLFQCMRCLNGLKVEIPNSPPTGISHMDFAFVLFDAGILVQDEYVWRYVVHLLILLCQRGSHAMVAKALITGKGRIFITHTLKMACIASDLDLVKTTFEFIVLTWMLDKGVADTYVEFRALSALVHAAERHPALADLLYQLWENSGVGAPEVREILDDLAHCDAWSYDLRHHLFDLSVRFRPREARNPDEPAEKDQLIAFLADHRGCNVLKGVWQKFPASWEAVMHVLWAIVQAKEKVQFTARYAEELAEQGMLPLILDFCADQKYCLGLAHCVAVLEFAIKESPAAEKVLTKHRHREKLEKAQRIAQTVGAVPQEVAWTIEGLLAQLAIASEEPATPLEEVLLNLPTELSEGNIAIVSSTILGIARSTPYRQQMRVAKGYPLLLNVITKYPHVPEVELTAVDVMWQLIQSAEDGLNAAVAEEFCEAGGVECIIHILSRYPENVVVTEHCWSILWSVVQNGPEAFCVPLKQNPEVLHLLAFTRTGGAFLQWVLKALDPLDILRLTIEAIHAAEHQLGSDPPDFREDTPNVARMAAKAVEREVRNSPVLENLVVMDYILVQMLEYHFSASGAPAAAPGSEGAAGDAGPQPAALRLVEEGAARTLCRCLEAAMGRVSEAMVLDTLGAIRMLLRLGQPLGATPVTIDGAHPPEEEPTTPIRCVGDAIHAQDQALKASKSLQDLQMEARMKSQIQIQSRVETLIMTLSVYWWSDRVCEETAEVLYTLLMSLISVDDDDLAGRLAKCSFVERCFESLFDQGPEEPLLGLVQFVSAVEDTEGLAWQLGGFDASYSGYLLTLSPVARSLCVAIMANHAMLDGDRRAWVASMGGLQMSQAVVKNPVCWEETWASMRMLAALAEPSDAFIVSTVCQGCLFVVADILSRVGVLRTTRATAQCLSRLLSVALTFRKALVERTAGSPSWQQGANPDLDQWLSDDALTAPLEMLLYRLHQLFLQHIHDIETMDFTIQYITLLLGMGNTAISTRLLRCNTRLLLTNIMSSKVLTPQLKKDAKFCLEELHAHALSHAQLNFMGGLENVVPVTKKPPVPAAPQQPHLQGFPGTPGPDAGASRAQGDADQAYLEALGVRTLFADISGALLAARPPREQLVQFVHKYLADKYIRPPPTKSSGHSKSKS